MSGVVETQDKKDDKTDGQTPGDAETDAVVAAPREGVRDLEPTRLVEAALFTAGRPVAVEELVETTGLAADVVKQAARSLEQEYEELGDATALEVGMAGAKWAMQLKTVYVEHAKSLARMEIPKKTLKTLALIAFHQPMLQSELVDMIGSKTYDHVRELTELGLVKSRPDGLSKRLSTSPEFPEYFGVPATDTQEIRVYLAKKVGLTLSEVKGEKVEDAPASTPASVDEVEQVAAEKEAEVDPEGPGAPEEGSVSMGEAAATGDAEAERPVEG